MRTIGQISEMFNIPISTLRYYDKEGLFPDMQRTSGIRNFSDKEIEALRVIECLKKSGMEIKAIKTFMEWCALGSETYHLRKELFLTQEKIVEAEIERLESTLAMIKFKCWYYEKAIDDGDEEGIIGMLPKGLPKGVQDLYDRAHRLQNFGGL